MRTGEHVLATVLAAVLAASCSDPQAGPLPTSSPSTGTPSPTATPDYEAEARRAIDAYFAALNAALRDPSNRTDALAALIDPSCPCVQAVEALREEARAGRYIDYSYTVTDIRFQQVGSLGASVTFTAHQTAGSQRTRDGRIVRSFAASTIRYSAHFQRGSSGWLLDRLDQIR